MIRSVHRSIVPVTAALLAVQTACAPDRPTDEAGGAPAANFARNLAPGTHRQYGTPITLGEGKVRSYVILDEKAGRKPIEVGVAIDARTMEGTLPNEMQMISMALPQHAPEPYRFVLFDWNPQGHPPEGVYDVPHFDFHFYFTPQAEVDAITRDDPHFRAKANKMPEEDFVPEFYLLLTPPGLEPADITEPRMGLHWEDRRDPQIQHILGNPKDHRPFTKTFIYGSWDGQFTFAEPMITREYLLRRANETIPVPQPKRYPKPGWYPNAYRISYDAQAKEYRVAIVDFSWRD